MWPLLSLSPPLFPPRRHSSSSSFHPRSTPRAVAHEAGGGWWVVFVGLVGLALSSLSPVIAVVRLLVLPPSCRRPPLRRLRSLSLSSSPFPLVSHPPPPLPSTLRAGARSSGGCRVSPSPHRPFVPEPAAPPLTVVVVVVNSSSSYLTCFVSQKKKMT
jgi:hypothetical protein